MEGCVWSWGGSERASDLPLTLVLFGQFIAVDCVDEHAIDDPFSRIVVNLVHLGIVEKWWPTFHPMSRWFAQVYTNTDRQKGTVVSSCK